MRLLPLLFLSLHLFGQCICPIKIPIEVVGLDGTSVTVPFDIPLSTDISQQATIVLQIHNLKYETEASLRVNNSQWMPINSATAKLQGLANNYGGIGGGFSTLSVTLTLPGGSLIAGPNLVTFRFNGTDGRTSGFRILAFNIQDLTGTNLIQATRFIADDPAQWQPPLNSPVDIASGKLLFQTASLRTQMTGPVVSIKAHCSDCHTQDGRDLKYFNYSNASIRARSIFHGLSAQQGDQIASYIRSLNTPAPGRPWNPPYQPGPGLDLQPVDNWSAGAGISSVLDSDAAMLKDMFPTGITASSFDPSGNWNTREQRISFQLPDWNMWLPQIHPMDAWPDFVTSKLAKNFVLIRSLLVPGSAAAYTKAGPQIAQWGADETAFMEPKSLAPASTFNQAYNQQLYSTLQWMMVKNWEIQHKFQLEGLANAVFVTPGADARAWYSGIPFMTSPNMLKVSKVVPTGLGNGSLVTRNFLAYVWYHLQLILNSKEKQQHGNTPIDFGYVYGFIHDLSVLSSPPQTALFTFWEINGLQIDNNGRPPNYRPLGNGWNWLDSDISRAVSAGYRNVWAGTSQADKTAIMTGLVTGWLKEVNLFTPSQYHAAGGSFADPNRLPVRGQPDSGNFEDRVWYMIPQFRYFGVPQPLVDKMASWAKTIWPMADWTSAANATCIPDKGDPTFARCSTEQ